MRSKPEDLEGDLEMEAQVRRALEPREIAQVSAKLEAELLVAYDKRQPAASLGWWTRAMGTFRAHRLAVAGLAGLFAVGGACVAPTDVHVPFGLGVELRGIDSELLDPEAVAHFLEEASGAHEISVQARRSEAGTDMVVHLWESDVSPGELEPELRDAFPELGDVEVEEIPLGAEVRTNWGRRLLHLALEDGLREEDIDRAREELVEQLLAEGVEGQVEIHIRDDGKRREVKVGVIKFGDDEGSTEGAGPSAQ